MDRQRSGRTKNYSPGILFLLILVAGLNILDSLFTMMVLDSGGRELNPVVRSVVALHGNNFWLWKFTIVSASLVLLCLHSNFRSVRFTIFGVSAVYVATVLYEIFLLN